MFVSFRAFAPLYDEWKLEDLQTFPIDFINLIWKHGAWDFSANIEAKKPKTL